MFKPRGRDATTKTGKLDKTEKTPYLKNRFFIKQAFF
jgi:hypothetical protein